MKLCQRYQIHLVSDEIYALSVWKNREHPDAVGFTSVLSIDLTGVIDPGWVHVLWGMSKASCHHLRKEFEAHQPRYRILAPMDSG
jgi:hypothetical protein